MIRKGPSDNFLFKIKGPSRHSLLRWVRLKFLGVSTDKCMLVPIQTDYMGRRKDRAREDVVKTA
ncbi:hypothetical protein SERLA73DRAFT_129878 [Serpula lacrymans var. lacrymans S7.3]|uniref:Uncharacterized protein n=2 Tax=Serpula lacrymans var. lacrymans TaxID=341189 RepID=F8PK82_SERL3|nr:uncharacterized protein SERLADRAFT_378070 [Serpula lacrymans var. lacrymans S7.9]EGO03536.1 hypothetical protein SERLA73DRAFT_129878 [Serpula lacrymans var. lacrymans S7.3]EGO29348.1 hypothetical protein SERLADRAFT_378070 [Serpula lacrymans var. lacrymans S7.9]